MTGILGGTFDPIHLGHLGLAEVARECLGLDRLLLVPAARSPHKPEPAAGPQARLEMCRLAAQGLDWVEVWDFELTRSGPSYTVETVEAYRRLWPGSRPVLILGWDTARELPSWERPQAILELADVAVVPRPGLPAPSLGELVGAGLAGTTVVCPGYTAPVQSTQIREAVRAGDSLAELVPTTVAAYIFANKLYL